MSVRLSPNVLDSARPIIMESTNRSRGRKGHFCYRCNVYFYQIDSWQRHNRKHTGVEIECDDCGEMCSDSFELKSHQQVCEAYRVYSQEHFTEVPGKDDTQTKTEPVHDTPDSTSKQEVSNETEDHQSHSTWTLNRSNRRVDTERSPTTSINEESNKTSELDDLIGEDHETSSAIETSEEGQSQEENDDLETEDLIGLDETVSNTQKSETSPSPSHDKPPADNDVGVDSQVVIKVESALNDTNRIQQKLNETSNRTIDGGPSFINRPNTSQPVNDNMQVMTLENSELNKKYQPYFCKNCGARFTRKDSVTRHLKKGTCSGKSAIVCHVCGKVFPEPFELQKHFKLDHKNVRLAPTLVTHRTILPKPTEHAEAASRQQHFPSYPASFALRDQHHQSGSRSHTSNDSQPYRPLPPHGMQGVFYPSSSGQGSYRHRNNYPTSNQSGHYREQHYPNSRQYDLKFSSGGLGLKDALMGEKTILIRKRRIEFRTRERYFDRDDTFQGKRNKPDSESSHDKAYHRDHRGTTDNKNQINLSEYTNNAMNSQQYYSKRFVKQEGSSINPDNENQSKNHQCKICGSEFPRYEYLLTHLRKHEKKPELEDDIKTEGHPSDRQDNNNNVNNNMSALNSPVDANEKRPSNFDLPKTVYGPNHEPVTVVMQQPPTIRYSEGSGKDNYLTPVDASPIFSLPTAPPGPPQAAMVGDNSLEAITPGVDGKFRPFICENCGQRFTRKDSLVRHAKKQTCYEEQTDLKCKHCDKTFRYHKCLFQHQELVHGVTREDQSKNLPLRNSEEDDTDSDRSERTENSGTDAKKKKSSNFALDVSSTKPFKTFHPATIPPPQTANFAGTPFAQLEQPNQMPPPPLSAPKFIPPRVEEKAKITHHQNENNGLPPPSGNVQDTQYIGYCTVPRPFQCEYCGDRFAHRHSLKRHIRRHLGIGIPCHECGKLYRDQSEWRRHQRSIHNRHYEKYEVPERISFRDGVAKGMIGVIQNSEYNFENNDGSDSDKSDEEISMVKNTNSLYTYDSEGKKLSEVTNQHGVPVTSVSVTEDEHTSEKNEDKENKQAKQSFNFKLHSAGDKDSRKSALDRYLFSSNCDEEEDLGEDERYEVTQNVSPKDESLETSEMTESGMETNNNNLIEIKSKVGSHVVTKTATMTTMDGTEA